MNATKFSLFGLGSDGIPLAYQRLLREENGPEKLARAIIDECQNSSARTESGVRLQSETVRATAQILIEWYSAKALPPPPIVAEATAHAWSLTSPDKLGQPLPPKTVRQELGLPTGVQLPSFMEAAGRDAFALALSVVSSKQDAVDFTRRVRAGEWLLAAAALSRVVGVGRSAIAAYRKKDEYRKAVTNFGVLVVFGWQLTERIRYRSNETIAARVLGLPRAPLLRRIGNFDAHFPDRLPRSVSNALSMRLRPVAEALRLRWNSAP